MPIESTELCKDRCNTWLVIFTDLSIKQGDLLKTKKRSENVVQRINNYSFEKKFTAERTFPKIESHHQFKSVRELTLVCQVVLVLS